MWSTPSTGPNGSATALSAERRRGRRPRTPFLAAKDPRVHVLIRSQFRDLHDPVRPHHSPQLSQRGRPLADVHQHGRGERGVRERKRQQVGGLGGGLVHGRVRQHAPVRARPGRAGDRRRPRRLGRESVSPPSTTSSPPRCDTKPRLPRFLRDALLAAAPTTKADTQLPRGALLCPRHPNECRGRSSDGAIAESVLRLCRGRHRPALSPHLRRRQPPRRSSRREANRRPGPCPDTGPRGREAQELALSRAPPKPTRCGFADARGWTRAAIADCGRNGAHSDAPAAGSVRVPRRATSHARRDRRHARGAAAIGCVASAEAE